MAVKQVVSKRSDLIQVHEHCPQRAYIELEVPQDLGVVLSIDFRVKSRDQGWADAKTGPSFTWFDASVDRPGGRANLRTLTVGNNDLANPEFQEHQWRWDSQSGLRYQNWLQALRSGDIIRLIPKVTYIAWVNIVQEASITLDYEPLDESSFLSLSTINTSVNGEHYASDIRHSYRKIRLLVLQPGNFEDPVRGYLRDADLSADSDPSVEFIALSYCWGDPLDRMEILIQSASHQSAAFVERPFSVTRNAGTALRRIRNKLESTNVWIDAVCVNQDDDKERAQQVSIMGIIYSQATAVHVWLGEDGNRGVETALRVIHDIYGFNCGECIGGDQCRCPGTTHSFNRAESEAATGTNPSFRSMYEIFTLHVKNFTSELINLCGGYNNVQLSEMLSVLFESPWFTRVWVVQEVLFSSNAFVRCNGEIIPWKEIVTINEWLLDSRYLVQQPHIKFQTMMVPIWKGLNKVQENRNRILGSNAPQDSVVAEASTLPGILDVFLDALDLKATDPRDRLYALLSFASETNVPESLDKLIKPDYNKPVGHVFADFTRWWIREHRSLAILSAIHCQRTRTWQRTSCQSIVNTNESRIQPSNQPSWAVSIEGRSRWAAANLEAQFDFKATGDTIPSEELLDCADPSTLRLRGIKVSNLKTLGHVPIQHIYPYRDDDVFRGDGVSGVYDRIFDPCGFSAFWSQGTIGTKGDPNLDQARRSYQDHISAHWNYFPGEKLRALLPLGDKSYEYYDTDELPTCLDPNFFVASNGLFGLCPSTAKEGDDIVLLYGGNVPYLLRPSGVNTFKLVGECFVEGIMKGEYLEHITETGQKSEVFCLI
ncbi:Heterokaryon incompatibility protein 6 OR allele [Lachnellula suecica]|uniref:Heterokaryon incompatibility protein 6 OR allele n=1 Tax=Lachnellula suecica TaxID=602035 RepID=A0A8T9BX85_9HELO|nr:Heterokaryon incompatibility protein 6 OR allele [Lachnellula suecica]